MKKPIIKAGFVFLILVAFQLSCLLNFGDDTLPPTIGTEITFTDTTSHSVLVHWGAADDADGTPSQNLMYKLIIGSDAASLNTVELLDAVPAAQVVLNWAENTTSFTVLGLTPGTTYWFAVLVRDGGLNETSYLPAAVDIVDQGAPVPQGELSVRLIEESDVRLVWEEATDDLSLSDVLEYKIVRALNAVEIDTVGEAQALADAAICMDWIHPTEMTKDVTDLSQLTWYSFSLLVRDATGNIGILGPATIRTLGPGYPDPSFGGDGIVTLGIGGFHSSARTTAVQADGKILVAGQFNDGNRDQIAVARFFPDGVLDAGFHNADSWIGPGVVTYTVWDTGYSKIVSSMRIRPSDGHVFVVCSLPRDTDGLYDAALLCYDETGAYDNSFSGDGVWFSSEPDPDILPAAADDYGTDLQFIPDGGGSLLMLDSAPGTVAWLLALTPSGGLDTSFNSTGILDIDSDLAMSTSIQAFTFQEVGSENMLLVAGQIYISGPDNYKPFVARIRYEGRSSCILDSGFGSGGFANLTGITGAGIYHTIAIQSDGKLLVGGETYDTRNGILARLNADGTIDATFGTNGYILMPAGAGDQAPGNAVYSIIEQQTAQGRRILAAGQDWSSFSDYNLFVNRYTPAGIQDGAFHELGFYHYGPGSSGQYSTMVLQPDGRIVLVGFSTEFILVRLLSE